MMQRFGIGGGLLSFSWFAGEHAGIRSLWSDVESAVRSLGLHGGARAGSVSTAWLREHDVEKGKRGDDE